MKLIIFHDAKCPLCVGWVKFLLDRDGNDRLRFAALQGEFAADFFREHGMEHPGMESVVVWNGLQLNLRSGAILTILEALPGIWHLGKHLRVLPLRLRESGYTFIAKRRHTLFGKYQKCWIPKPGERSKFLDLDAEATKHEAHGDLSKDNPDADPRPADL